MNAIQDNRSKTETVITIDRIRPTDYTPPNIRGGIDGDPKLEYYHRAETFALLTEANIVNQLAPSRIGVRFFSSTYRGASVTATEVVYTPGSIFSSLQKERFWNDFVEQLNRLSLLLRSTTPDNHILVPVIQADKGPTLLSVPAPDLVTIHTHQGVVNRIPEELPEGVVLVTTEMLPMNYLHTRYRIFSELIESFPQNVYTDLPLAYLVVFNLEKQTISDDQILSAAQMVEDAKQQQRRFYHDHIVRK